MSDSTIAAADSIGTKTNTNAIPQENPSALSSVGVVGKQFNPEGPIGSMGQAVGGPFAKDGMIGKQFDAGQDGLAGHVERMVDGPRNPAGSDKKI